MDNVLTHIQIEVPCSVCRESYVVSAETVRESQRLRGEGCPGTSPYECPPLYLGELVPEQALDRLASALTEVEESAERQGARVVWREDDP